MKNVCQLILLRLEHFFNILVIIVTEKQIILSWMSGAIISMLLVTTAMTIICAVSKKSQVSILESGTQIQIWIK